MAQATSGDAAGNPSGLPCEQSEAALAAHEMTPDPRRGFCSAASLDSATAAQSRRLTPGELSIAMLELERVARLLLVQQGDSPAFRMQYSQWATKLMSVAADGDSERVQQAIVDILLMLDVDPDSVVKVVTPI